MLPLKQTELSYEIAKERYANLGVDTDAVLEQLANIPISIHCWQGDDVVGFEKNATGASGGILATGNYPGRARSVQELRQDIEKAFSLIPGKKRINLHSIYADVSNSVDRAELQPEHFQGWIDWAKTMDIAIDFNPTCFSHPMAATGFTLSSHDDKIRKYWIRHVKACRKISAEFGRQLGKRSNMNIWIPDGYKDVPVNRVESRRLFKESLDEILSEKIDHSLMRDAIESKLFGIGLESCTIGSSEFCLAYALKNNIMLTLDSGHFHPTEIISDKISSILLFADEILLHVSRPVRWDSDHVVTFDDELQNIAAEIIRTDVNRVNIALDYFDATINRIAAWVIGTRNMQKALCKALLEPAETLRAMERDADYTSRLALTEELKSMPFEAVYDYFCLKNGFAVGYSFMDAIRKYEVNVTMQRS